MIQDTKQNNSDKTKAKIEEIIRGQRSAVEAYRSINDKIGADPKMDPLKTYSADHIKATQYFTEYATARGMEVPDSSGAWGTWVKFTTEAAKTFGDTASLKILKEGEEHGLKMFREIADDDNVDPSVRSTLKNHFIPTQKSHVKGIEYLLENN